MRELERELKPSLLGGYDRESVLKVMETLLELTQDLQGRLEESQGMNKSLVEQNTLLHQQYTALADCFQGVNRNMESLLRDNSYLVGQVERYKALRMKIAALRAGMEDEASHIVDDVLTQTWVIEETRGEPFYRALPRVEPTGQDTPGGQGHSEDAQQREKAGSNMLPYAGQAVAEAGAGLEGAAGEG